MTELKCRIEQWIYRIHQWVSERGKMKGSWVECESMMICNCCGKHFSYADNETDDFYFCPNCGADMRERKESKVKKCFDIPKEVAEMLLEDTERKDEE